MNDLSRPWPLGLDSPRWPIVAAGALLIVLIAAGLDGPIAHSVPSWPEAFKLILAQASPYGESDWILYPAAGLYVITAGLALVMRWRLMRTMLWQFAALYAFIFVGVGAPTLLASTLKRLVGRGRPGVLDSEGLWSLHPNWSDFMHQSFPSGHAATAFALATVLGFVSPRWFKPALALAAVIALSRISLGLHYASDIVIGAPIGVLGAYAVRWVFARLRWTVEANLAGEIAARPLASLRCYIAIMQRRSAGGSKTTR